MILIFLPLLVLVHFTYGADTVLWKNNDFPEDDPLKNFHPQEHGFFNYGSLTAAKDPAGGHQNVLRVFYKKGTYSQIRGLKGAQFYSQPSSTHTAMTLSYQVYFSHGFDFVKGGKLPGLYGGETATCSGGRHSASCFSARLMWRAHGDGEIYSYIPHQSAAGFCDRSDIECNSIKGTSLGRSKWRYSTGKWIKITEHVHLNTVGKNDGFAKIWIDGKLMMTAKDIVWRNDDKLKINGIFFSTFFGGATTEWAATKDCYTYFKDFVLSMGASVPHVLG